MKKRQDASQIVRILRDIETCKTVSEGVRKHNITEQTYVSTGVIGENHRPN